MSETNKSIDMWNGKPLPPGGSYTVELAIGESYSGMTLHLPLRIQRAAAKGPTVLVTAALHGDEINGTGAIRTLIQDDTFRLSRGSVMLVPVLNLLAFDRHSRYLPDRRDLNRCFPGSPGGSLASRLARHIFDELVMRADYVIDLHTASIRRTNYPNVRADMSDPETRQLAEAFGAEIIINGKGPKGALRREACRVGRPTIVMEGGEVWKVEPTIVESAVCGIRNVLYSLDMLEDEVQSPDYQIVIERSKWVRADYGGFLQFHVQPGEVVEKGARLATNTNLLGEETSAIECPFSGVVLGMTTLPAVSPGEPVCHIGQLPRNSSPHKLRRQRRQDAGFQENVLTELASNVMVVEPSDD